MENVGVIISEQRYEKLKTWEREYGNLDELKRAKEINRKAWENYREKITGIIDPILVVQYLPNGYDMLYSTVLTDSERAIGYSENDFVNKIMKETLNDVKKWTLKDFKEFKES